MAQPGGPRALLGLLTRAYLLLAVQRRRNGSTRERILDIAARRPGIPLTRLKNRLDVSWGTLFYHIGILRDKGLVRTVRAGRRRLLFPAGVLSGETALVAVAFLEGETARRVACAIRERPDARIEELAALTGKSRRVVYYHVKQLLDAGLAIRSSRTRHFGLRIDPRVADVVDAIAERKERG